jgi:putative copper export protein
MDILLFACRGLHVFGVAVWCGGLMYEGVVIIPESGMGKFDRLRRFVPFVWMSAWTILLSGTALMLFSPRFVFLQYEDAWSVILGLKQMAFLLMVFFAFGTSRMLSRLKQLGNGEPDASAPEQLLVHRALQFHRMNVALAITGILLGSMIR